MIPFIILALSDLFRDARAKRLREPSNLRRRRQARLHRLGEVENEVKDQRKKVDEQKGNAKWDADKAELKVTLPIIHDWDAKAAVSSANDLD